MVSIEAHILKMDKQSKDSKKKLFKKTFILKKKYFIDGLQQHKCNRHTLDEYSLVSMNLSLRQHLKLKLFDHRHSNHQLVIQNYQFPDQNQSKFIYMKQTFKTIQ